MRTKGGCLKEESQKGASFISDSGGLPSGVLFKPRSHTAYSKPLLKPPHLLGGKPTSDQPNAKTDVVYISVSPKKAFGFNTVFEKIVVACVYGF